MIKRAQCQCGALAVEIEGPEEAVVMCSCTECQRRSGSPFGEGAYYQRSQVKFIGEAREYVRAADSGKPFHQFFCPTCATTLYFWSERDPNRIGVAVGAFADSAFRRPDRSVFDSRKHAWVNLPADMPGFARGRDSERTR